MPHLILHYSKELETHVSIGQLLETLSRTLGEIESIRREDIKARAIPITDYVVGNTGSTVRTFNIQLVVMPGRPPEIIATALDRLLEESRRLVPGPVEITIESRDLDPNRYRKVRIS
jgi:5-carboxymethyl-2-hydroxymuconate isomerase